ncbi:TPA: cytochrome c oxidase accessory protein CcoG, partial [Neisseria gonorrhoeae]
MYSPNTSGRRIKLYNSGNIFWEKRIFSKLETQCLKKTRKMTSEKQNGGGNGQTINQKSKECRMTTENQAGSPASGIGTSEQTKAAPKVKKTFDPRASV